MNSGFVVMLFLQSIGILCFGYRENGRGLNKICEKIGGVKKEEEISHRKQEKQHRKNLTVSLSLSLSIKGNTLL